MPVTKHSLQVNKTMFGSNYKGTIIMYRHLTNLMKEDIRTALIALLDIIVAKIFFTDFEHVSSRCVVFISEFWNGEKQEHKSI